MTLRGGVLLVQPPFASLRRPSIGLSSLKASLEAAGFCCSIRYLNLEFAARIGVELYEAIAERLPQELLVGELVFSASAFGRTLDGVDILARVRTHISGSPGRYGSLPGWVIERIPVLQRTADRFIQEVAAEEGWSELSLVGMGTMFQQNVACLALARRLKERPGTPPILLGGANCEGEMGEALHRLFPCVDFVCRGEGEGLVVELARHLSRGVPALHEIRGLVWRQEGRTVCNGLAAPRMADLDALPTPTYWDWMEQRRRWTPELDPEDLMLPLETSRGCWYGAKQHCIFCGLNGESMTYRAKSPARVLAEIDHLRQYGIDSVHAVDNILNLRYFDSVLPALARRRHGLNLFYEVKSNLKREQLQALWEAGVTWIQPGIESLDTAVLRLMRKGVSALQNVRLLKWAAELGMGVAWNILYGFPREDPESYRAMARLVPSLVHLPAPLVGCNRVRLDRFSPLFDRGRGLGVTRLRPFRTYALVYDLPERELERLAYYFEMDAEHQGDPDAYVAPLVAEVRRWQSLAGSAAFTAVDRAGALHLFDDRPGAQMCVATLEAEERAVMLSCEEGATAEEVAARTGLPRARVEELLWMFEKRRWTVLIDGRHLALAIRMDCSLPREVPLAILGPLCQAIYRHRMAGPRARVERALELVPLEPEGRPGASR